MSDCHTIALSNRHLLLLRLGHKNKHAFSYAFTWKVFVSYCLKNVH